MVFIDKSIIPSDLSETAKHRSVFAGRPGRVVTKGIVTNGRQAEALARVLNEFKGNADTDGVKNVGLMAQPSERETKVIMKG